MYKLLLILLLITVSCDKKFVAPEPDNLIEQSVMERILYDIKLLKASKSKSYKVLKDNNVQADLYIYEKYKVDSITLRQNIEYYATASFKKSKEIEENIKAQFETNKVALEKSIADKVKADKTEDSIKKIEDTIKLPREKFRSEIYPSLIDENSFLVTSDYLKWLQVNSVFDNSKENTEKDPYYKTKLVSNKTKGQHRVDIHTLELNGEYEFSVYAKKAELNYIGLRIGLKGYSIIFNLDKGVVHGEHDDIVAKIKQQRLGWYKCSVKCKVDSVSVIRINIFKSNSYLDYSGNDVDGVYLGDINIQEVTRR